MSAAPARASIGVITAIALVVGNMIGSGLFLLPASLAPYGPAALLGWGASACGALAIAFVFARLSRRLPQSGGPYTYARAAFGDATGFVVAWSYWVSIWCANAAIAIAFAGYVGALLPATTATPLRAALLAVAALWTCTLTNALGVRSAGRMQVITTALKLLPLVTLALFAVPAVDVHHWQPVNPSGQSLWTVLALTTSLTMWAFLGVESATIPAELVRDPVRNVPRATLVGATLAIVVTVVSCTIVSGLLPPDALAHSNAPFADAASRIWGTTAGLVFAAAAAIACFGALNGWVLAQGQIPLAAARDGVFPTAFARVDARGTPLFGLLASSALASVLVIANFQKSLVQLFTFSILLSTAATLLPYVVCSAALWHQQRSQRHPGGERMTLLVASVAFVFSIAALIGIGAEALAWGVALVLAGVPVFHWRPASRVDATR